jgi:hypothetical protein
MAVPCRLALALLAWGFAACASSFEAGRARVDDQFARIQDAHGAAAGFQSLTFYRLAGLGGLHAYLGVRFLHTALDARECAHDFTLGLSTGRDLREFERSLRAGTVGLDASDSFRYTDYGAAVDALHGVVAISNTTIYRRYDAAFYLGLLFTPLLGRPCANVVEAMERYLSAHPNAPEAQLRAAGVESTRARHGAGERMEAQIRPWTSARLSGM